MSLKVESTIWPILIQASKQLEIADIESARLDAEVLLAHALGWDDRSRLYLDRDHVVPSATLDIYQHYIKRRAESEPVAYITGVQEFWSLPFHVNKHTLIPRPDTETLIQAVADRIGQDFDGTILDMGTGSGCILLSLLSQLGRASGDGIDISQCALETATLNALELGLAGRARFTKSDWLSNVTVPKDGYGVIVSNPPYIPQADLAALMKDVRDFEPMSALDGGEDGLKDYRRLTEIVPTALAKGGLFAVEIGIGQEGDVVRLFKENGFENIETHKDLASITRVISAFWP